MIRRTLKYTLIVVVAAVIGYASLTVYGEVNQTEAARMSGSVQLSENQAENMNRALGDVSVFAGGNSAGNAAEAGSQPETFEIAKITSIDALIDRWEPRYDDAKLAYVKFEAAIDNAKASAAGYFATQQALTERINDPAAKARAREDDEHDLALYRQWEAQADSALAKARAIGNTAGRHGREPAQAGAAGGFCLRHCIVPGSAGGDMELNAELSEFRVASETIRAATESPLRPNDDERKEPHQAVGEPRPDQEPGVDHFGHAARSLCGHVDTSGGVGVALGDAGRYWRGRQWCWRNRAAGAAHERISLYGISTAGDAPHRGADSGGLVGNNHRL